MNKMLASNIDEPEISNKTGMLKKCVAIIAISTVSYANAASIRIEGSSTVSPITEIAINTFNKQNASKLEPKMGELGTSDGFKKLCQGSIDIANASRQIKPEEAKACETAGIAFYEFLIAYDGVVVIASKQNTWTNSFTLPELKRIWEPAAFNNIKSWHQLDSSWPNEAINLTSPDMKSGTAEFFSEKITGVAKMMRGDINTVSDHDEVVNNVSKHPGGLGYVGFAYYKMNMNRVRAIPVDFGKGAILPDHNSIISGNYSKLARPLFIYVNKASVENGDSTFKAFVQYYLDNAAKFTEKAMYVPLVERNYTDNKTRFNKGQTGKAF